MSLWYNVCIENREMQTSNPAEMVTISRAEYEQLQQGKCAVGSKKSTKLEKTAIPGGQFIDGGGGLTLTVQH